jgi:predicted enzyme related to lactoylglutathione lyase
MGKPVVHWEFWSMDPARVSDFYSKVFDWKIQDMPEMNYRIVDTGGQGGINGGIMTPKRDGPWPGNMSFYIDVDDLASYRKRITAAGGKILVEEQAVPGMGAFALFSDPDGRVLGIWKRTGA